MLLALFSGPLTTSAQSVGPRCGTFLLDSEASDGGHGGDRSEKSASLLTGIPYGRQNLDRNIVSRDGHFRIHFDDTGQHAPPPQDLDRNGIPDFIDSVDFYMEFAWKREVEECRYDAPPQDNIKPNVGGVDGKIDVYVVDLCGVIYGAAFKDVQIDARRWTSYMTIDNDFSGYPTPGIAGLRVTTAHEFHHILQFSSYLYSDQAALYEATATWMEFKLHPDLNDYRNYFQPLLLAPQDYAFSTHAVDDGITGYGHMEYLLLLSSRLDENIVREIWERFRSNGRSFDAINEALLARDAGLNLANSYCTFARWSYHTGHRNEPDSAFFSRADQYTAMVPAQTRSMPVEGYTTFVDALMPLSFGVWQLTIPGRSGAVDTVDFLITNARDDIGTGGSHWLRRAENFLLDVSDRERPGFLPVEFGSETLWYRLESPHQNFCLEIIVNGARGTTTLSYPTPQPFRNDGADNMLFAVRTGSETTIHSYRLEIYSQSMSRVAILSGSGLETANGLKGILWDGRDGSGETVPSGIYIYTLQINDEEPSVGKVAVILE